MQDAQDDSVLILGIGNVLWADEGFGPRCVEALADRFAFPDNVRLLDGGTQGLYLLPFIEEVRSLLIFDAVDYGLAPGTLKIVRDDDVPSFMGAKKMSLHQTGFQDVLATASFKGCAPARMTLIGCQPEEMEDYGGSLRESIAAQIAPAIAAGVEELARWGIKAVPGRTATDDLADASLRRDAYESGRPSAEDACRAGDDRFFPGRS
ncbi:Hydrogenase maturation protease [Rhodovulum sp. P5]|uniref:HyaD/HybD family hydrogenase maturation endopeptidase n=1 Tax=Rhodovulum sp. P5 TaxID=1564506 RepID=UPI0009C36B50|nr:HyaD/HybD family hydrogenase maturation endopeptidase [Rhodovulum sp. P5]ARE40682.1 Hydrogenase maturation protease [Rhodovulum sp. P5]